MSYIIYIILVFFSIFFNVPRETLLSSLFDVPRETLLSSLFDVSRETLILIYLNKKSIVYFNTLK
ncbi:MAG: hypothetical protein V8Q71_01085 [Bacilli bacterium]